MRQVYLDYAAATPMKPAVVQAMLPYFQTKFYNPSAAYLPALEVRADYQAAKVVIARELGVKADQLIMTAGATESINLAFSTANRVLISSLEHPATQAVARSKSQCQLVPILTSGLVDVDQLENLIDDETDLVSVSLVSSDLGTIQPIAEIGQIIKTINLKRRLLGNKRVLLFHCDASQALGYLEVKPGRLGVDLLTISAAKIGGPKQVGALWVRPGIQLQPLLYGGGQELGLRGGTENVAGVIGFAAAIASLARGRQREIAKLRDYFEQKLLKLPNVRLLGHPKKRLPNYLVLSFSDVEAERLIYYLEERGVFVSTGAACAANRGKASLALVSLGLTEAEQIASLRLTLGAEISRDDVDYAGQMIIDAVKLERERVRKCSN